MSLFGGTLVQLRTDLGLKSSKSGHDYFYSRGLECNYQYYVKIEKGLVLPSSNLVNQLAKILKDKSKAEALVQAFCAEQFKSFVYLFKQQDSNPESENAASKSGGSTDHFPQGQKTLSLKQVHTLARKKETYYLFLLASLARRPLLLNEIEHLKGLKSSLNQLQEEGILLLNNNEVAAVSTEFIFPAAESDDLKQCFKKFDDWDKEFEQEFRLENSVNKMMIRRISSRYLHLILQQIEVLSSTLRVSDESDSRYNNKVVQLQIRLSKGELPG